MAPPKGDSAATRHRRMQQRADAIAEKLEVNVLISIIKYDPDTRKKIKAHVNSLGKWPEDNEPLQKPSEDVVDSGAEAAVPVTRQLDGEGASTAASGGTVATGIEIHRNFQRWGQAPPRNHRLIFQALEPTALSDANIRGTFNSKSQKEMDRAVADQILEALTGVTQQDEIGEERTLDAHIELFKTLNEERGRPLRDVVLRKGGVDWPRCGWYRPELGDDGMVRICRLGMMRAIPHELAKNKKFADLYVDQNWSREQAVMRCVSDLRFRVKLAPLFENDDVVLKPEDATPTAPSVPSPINAVITPAKKKPGDVPSDAGSGAAVASARTGGTLRRFVQRKDSDTALGEAEALFKTPKKTDKRKAAAGTPVEAAGAKRPNKTK